MNRSILMCLLLLTGFTFNSVFGAVTVTVNQEQYEFAHEPSLVEVLTPITNKQGLYWPAATLYRSGDTELEKMRFSLLNHLSTLVTRYLSEEPEISHALEQLHATIASWRLARRLPLKIDYDLARIVATKNPRFPKGAYIISVAPRVDTVKLFGAIKNAGTMPHMPHMAHADVREYLSHQTLGVLADKDYVIIIQADGRKIKAPVAYWNKSHQEVMPGSQVFVAFKPSLFHPEFATINQQIITLALNRVQQ
jgi:hypothetical protein